VTEAEVADLTSQTIRNNLNDPAMIKALVNGLDALVVLLADKGVLTIEEYNEAFERQSPKTEQKLEAEIRGVIRKNLEDDPSSLTTYRLFKTLMSGTDK
jgi:hypothetical protein